MADLGSLAQSKGMADLNLWLIRAENAGVVQLAVHNTRELDRVLGIDGIDLIGINNRDLETFQVDINNTVELLKGARGDTVSERNILVVGESGLFTPQDIALLQTAGVKAVLVGESLVKQDDPAAGITDLFGKDISLSRQAELQVAA
ncbi:hypothetical protein L7F22_045377 [Adiantum nelumboides]|nr:hypothetical protein [Adiantum nelumboides]